MGKDTKALRAVAQVVLDFALWRIHPAPIRIGRKRERVQQRGDVTGTTRIGVIAPCPSNVVCPLDYHKIIVAALFQAHRHAQSRKPRSQYSDMNMRGTVITIGQYIWKGRASIMVVRRHLPAASALENPGHTCFLRFPHME